jgi:hypothetical protein
MPQTYLREIAGQVPFQFMTQTGIFNQVHVSVFVVLLEVVQYPNHEV